MPSQQLGTNATWLERLAELLITGVPIEDAVLRCGAAGVSEDTIRTEAEAMLGDPLFEVAKVVSIRLICRDWWLRACADLSELGDGPSYVQVRNDLGRDEFLRRYYFRNRPVHLPGIAGHWPALNRWTPEYLSQITADVNVMLNRGRAPAHQRSVPSRFTSSMRFSDFVSLVYSGEITDDYYLVGKNKFFDHPSAQILLDDIEGSPFVSIGDGSKKVTMWFGPAGTLTPIHYDDVNTLLVQVRGRKTLRLYSPYYSEHMQQRRAWYGDVDPADVDSGEVDSSRSPVEKTLRGALVTLAPGDALFIPVGWWHAVKAVDVSISLSFKEFGVLNDFGSSRCDRV